MCQILGDQFVQYLPVVMKPLLRAASLDLCIIFINGECDMNLVCYHILSPAPKPQNCSLFDKSTKFLMGFVTHLLSDFRRGGM